MFTFPIVHLVDFGREDVFYKFMFQMNKSSDTVQ